MPLKYSQMMKGLIIVLSLDEILCTDWNDTLECQETKYTNAYI